MKKAICIILAVAALRPFTSPAVPVPAAAGRCEPWAVFIWWAKRLLPTEK